MDILVTDRLGKRYGSRRGIEDLSLSISEGTVFGLLGPNGSGKTTTIRLLLGFLRPTAGTARILGLDCWHDSRRIKEDLGYLPGDLRLYPWLTGQTALKIFGRARRRSLLAEGRTLAEEFGLDLNVRVSRMSRGMRQKLGLILTLAHRPRLLVLDEPTSSLDPIVQETLGRRLHAMAACGHTVVFSSHTLSEVERLCERVVILRQGRIVADEGLETLRKRAGREVVLRWKTPAAAQAARAPEFLEVVRRDSCEWRCMLRGHVQALVEWLCGKELDDLLVGSPDLETLFQRYYQK